MVLSERNALRWDTSLQRSPLPNRCAKCSGRSAAAPATQRCTGGADYNDALSDREAGFIAARDSFYMASAGETGWPYVQHRGGPAGFVRVLDERTIGFADFRGNRQYVSVGNVRKDDRVALIFMDYPNRTRLKMLGCARFVGDDEPELLAKLEADDSRAPVERGFVIRVKAFDWNCPQHITPRYTQAEIEALIGPLTGKSSALKSGGSAPRPARGARQWPARARRLRRPPAHAADPRVRAARSKWRRSACGQDRCPPSGAPLAAGRQERYSPLLDLL
jgi:predicted pyridoxine 5'-phosphate oxidase superfamily flavin-nucleotide-binding protein